MEMADIQIFVERRPENGAAPAIAFFASSGKIPPEELAMRSGKSFDFAAKTERGKTGFA